MDKILTLVTLVIAIVAAGVFVYTESRDRPPIEKVRIESHGKTILMTVFLNQPQTCEQVISGLGVKELSIKSKVYAPVCTVIKKDFMKIVFEEKTVT